METFFAYHVVTDKPMKTGQKIIFNKNHHSGVYERVMKRRGIVEDIYMNPEKYDAAAFEHHTAVAIRELALEEVRRKSFPEYPSRLACLYVSDNIDDAEMWADMFVNLGRPVYDIVRLKISGAKFEGDANNCFYPSVFKQKNIEMALHYWKNLSNKAGENPIKEILVSGNIEVSDILPPPKRRGLLAQYTQ